MSCHKVKVERFSDQKILKFIRMLKLQARNGDTDAIDQLDMMGEL